MGTTDGGRTPGKQPSQQSPKGLIYYFLTIFLVTMLLNALVFPNVMEEKVMEVNYNEFLAMVDAGKRWSRWKRTRTRSCSWPRTPRERSRSIRLASGGRGADQPAL